MADISISHILNGKMLFLARRAPNIHDAPPGRDPEVGVRLEYHYEILHLLLALGFDVEPRNSLDCLLNPSLDYAYVFSIYNQAPFNGSEVFVTALCEKLKMPYLGARPYSRLIAQDKHLTKILARHLEITIPDWKTYRREDNFLSPPNFSGPFFVKPRSKASSIGIDENSIRVDWKSAIDQIKYIFAMDDDAILERYIHGSNVTVPIIGGLPPLILPAVELRSPKDGNIITYPQKRLIDRSLSRVIFEDSKRTDELRELSLRLYNELQPVDYLRVDFRVPTNAAEPPFLLETNIACNIGSHASISFAARAVGLSHPDLISKILDHSFRRQNVGR